MKEKRIKSNGNYYLKDNINYKNTKSGKKIYRLYRIVNINKDVIYVGITTQTLKRRFNNGYGYNFDTVGCSIELIGETSDPTHETYWINYYKSLGYELYNKMNGYTTEDYKKEQMKDYSKEHYQKNKEQIKDYSKEHYQKNKEHRKEQMKEYRKEYYQKNKEQTKEQTKEYYQKNKEQMKEYRKKYYQKNKEQTKEQTKEYYQKNKEHMKEYYQKNKEQIKEYNKEYYQKNKEQIKEYNKEYYQKNKK